MAKTITRPWDPAEHLNTQEDIVAYFEAALEDGDSQLIASVLGDIARSKGMTEIARETGLGRESLYKALSPNGNPRIRHRAQGNQGTWNQVARHRRP